MKSLIILLIWLLPIGTALAQRGDIVVPTGAVIDIPAHAQICADRIYANNPGYGTLTLANSTCLCPGMAVVPVELLVFSASADNGVVILRWSTASEVNCHGFEVQRRLPGFGEEWHPLGFVQGGGTSTETRNYIFPDVRKDVRPDIGTLAYRLRMIDFDGSFTYSSIVEVRFEAASQPWTFYPVYPNPASDRVTVSFSIPQPSDVTLTLYSVTGAEVMKLIAGRFFESGFHTASIPVSGLSRGTYMIELRSGSMRRTQTLVLLN